ncbi:hypothetical protein LWE61_01220 [Sphingobium sufflavum]|uniref:hypothetical protein n=1 Tax=Sphingobium sufflavum TaxID=1129547 RepID=UPI001F1C6BCE|nr:hypothetical protein [Sphingobium sufflavum]MCE7795169.1 hypothetical protein [Sphingobium sufflavum]
MKFPWAIFAPSLNLMVRSGIAKRRKAIRQIGRRAAVLQNGFAFHLFESAPDLKTLIDAGSDFMRALTAVEKAKETARYWKYENVWGLFEVIDIYTKNGNRLLDDLDKGKPKLERIFKDQDFMRGWFDAPYY